jgi:predicted nucleotide-binding protein
MAPAPDALQPRQEDALRRLYQADTAGTDGESFKLYYSGEGPVMLHGGWDRSWSTPSNQTVDDLAELGLLRVDASEGRGRDFAITLQGREIAKGLIEQLGTAPVGQSAPEERSDHREASLAEVELAVDSFLSRAGLELFSAEELADAVPNPKFETVAAVRFLKEAAREGRVAPISGRWRVEVDAGDSLSYHVRVAAVDARDLLGGPIYAFDLSEDELVSRFVAPYQAGSPINFGDRDFASYRKPKITRLYGSGAETVRAIRERLAKSRRVHSPHEAEELFFKHSSEDVTDNYLNATDPELVRVNPAAQSSAPESSGETAVPSVLDDEIVEKGIFVVHGHQRRDEVARFIQRVTGITPIILDEQAGRGRTIIEKFEEEARPAAYAVVLLTEDDLGKAKDGAELRPRARQNAVLELGYFIGKIGRENVAVLHEQKVEILSDYQGVEYISFSDNWQAKLMRELRAAGIPIDPAGI